MHPRRSGSWLLLCGFLAACSHAGGGAAPGFSPALDALPLHAATPVEVCLDDRMLVPRSTLGFCVPVEAPRAACGACGAREACACDRCTLRACAANGECASGERCRRGRCERLCDADATCAPGERCRSGACVGICQYGCHIGERCEADLCEAAVCQRDADCGSAERCDLVREHAVLAEPALSQVEGASSQVRVAVEQRRAEGSRILLGAAVSPYRWRFRESATLEAMRPWEAGSVGAPALDGDRIYWEGGFGAGIARGRWSGPGSSVVVESSPLLTPVAAFEEGFVGSPAAAGTSRDVVLYEAGAAVAASMQACASDRDCTTLERCRLGRCRAMARVIAEVAIDAAGRAEDGSRRVVLDGRGVEAASARRTTGEPLWIDVAATGAPSVLRMSTPHETLRFLFFTGVGRERPDIAPNRSLGLAVARGDGDFVPFAYNPALSASVLFTQPLGESAPAAIVSGAAAWRVCYEAHDPSGAYSGIACSESVGRLGGEPN